MFVSCPFVHTAVFGSGRVTSDCKNFFEVSTQFFFRKKKMLRALPCAAFEVVPEASSREEEQVMEEGPAVTSPPPKKKESDEKRKSVNSYYSLYRLWVFVFYLVSGPLTILLNAFVMTEIDFPHAAVLSLLGVATSTLLSTSLVFLGVVPSTQYEATNLKFYVFRVVPIGFALAGTLAAGNASYLHLSVAFVQILKAFSPVVLLVMLFLTKLENPRSLLLLSIAIIVGGVLTATEGEIRVTLVGVLLCLLSQISDAIKTINIQILLTNLKFDAFESLAVYGPAACLGLGIVALLTEDCHDAYLKVKSEPFLFLTVSLSGFCVNVSSTLMLKETSALTLRILAQARNVGVVVFSSIIFKTPISPLEAAGYLLCLLGCFVYSHARTNPNATITSALQELKENCPIFSREKNNKQRDQETRDDDDDDTVNALLLDIEILPEQDDTTLEK